MRSQIGGPSCGVGFEFLDAYSETLRTLSPSELQGHRSSPEVTQYARWLNLQHYSSVCQWSLGQRGSPQVQPWFYLPETQPESPSVHSAYMPHACRHQV